MGWGGEGGGEGDGGKGTIFARRKHIHMCEGGGGGCEEGGVRVGGGDVAVMERLSATTEGGDGGGDGGRDGGGEGGGGGGGRRGRVRR